MASKPENKNDGKMTVMRSTVLIVVAVIFDVLQFFSSAIFTALGGLSALVAFLDAGAIAGIATAVGAMINLILSIYAILTFFILLKLWQYKGWKVIAVLCGAFVLEEIPLGNNLPFWTGWAIQHVINDYKQQALDKVPGGSSLKAMPV